MIRVAEDRRRLRAGLAILLFVLFAVAAAGPQWIDRSDLPAPGRGELLLLIDLSRSMEAQQPSRKTLAIRSLRHLVSHFERVGGPRIACVAFAAESTTLFPFTRDLRYVRWTLDRLEMGDGQPPAPPSDAPPSSGTRIGAALKSAFEWCAGPRQRPTVVLVSDGDDPANDQEWVAGVELFRGLRLPIHVIGLGDPDRSASIPTPAGPLLFAGETVKTQRNDRLLREIATRTGGIALLSETTMIPLGDVIPNLLSQTPETQTGVRWQPKPFHGWLFLAASILFASWLVISERLPYRRRYASLSASLQKSASPKTVQAAAVAVLALFSLSAASPTDEALRQGERAYHAKDYATALRHFERAAAMTPDPGFVAFNKACTLYRLNDFHEAEVHFRRCLEDSEAPRHRQMRAWFDLGNCLLKQGSAEGPRFYREASEAFRQAISLAAPTDPIFADSRYNLELAQNLWIRHRRKDHDPASEDPSNEPKVKKGERPGKEGQNDGKDPSEDASDDDRKGNSEGKDPQGKTSKNLRAGPLQVLPDQERPTPLDARDVARHLEQALERIRREQQRAQDARRLPSPDFKDW